MANNLSNHDGLIIIGVDEETDYSICDITSDPNRRKTQDIVVFLQEKKFAGGIRPTVYVQSLSFRKSEIDIIVIRNDRNTPYYLTDQYQGVSSSCRSSGSRPISVLIENTSILFTLYYTLIYRDALDSPIRFIAPLFTIAPRTASTVVGLTSG